MVDVIEESMYGLGKKEAAAQLASDFGLAYEDWKPPGRARTVSYTHLDVYKRQI